MAVSCVFKKLQEDEEDSSQELKALNEVDEDDVLLNDPVLALGKINIICNIIFFIQG